MLLRLSARHTPISGGDIRAQKRQVKCGRPAYLPGNLLAIWTHTPTWGWSVYFKAALSRFSNCAVDVMGLQGIGDKPSTPLQGTTKQVALGWLAFESDKL